MSYYPNQSSYPGRPQSSYPGGPQSSYPGGPQSSYPGDPLASQPSGYNAQPSSYPGGPQSSYPGGPSQNYNAAPSYNSHPSSPSPYPNQQAQGPMQYDQNGNPIEGERGLGTMAAGAAAGWAGNKMTGGHMGTFGSMASGAILAQVGKKVFEKFEENKHHNNGGYGGNSYGPPQGHHGSGGGFGSFFK